LLAVVRRQAGTRWIEAPPALEAPEALVADAQPRDPSAAPAGISGLEVEEALEHGGGPGAIGLALAGVEEDQAGRARADLVARALRAPPAVSTRLWRPAGRAAIGPRLDPTVGTTGRRRR
jgi:hypothetical protein